MMCVCALFQHKNNIEHSGEPAVPTSSLNLVLFFWFWVLAVMLLWFIVAVFSHAKLEKADHLTIC